MNLKINCRYSFDVYAPTVFGGNFKNVQVMAIMDASTAAAYRDIFAVNASVKPYLPVGTIADPLKLTYVRIRNHLGNEVVIAYEWIVESSIVLSVGSQLQVTLDNASATDAQRIRDILTRERFVIFEIKEV